MSKTRAPSIWIAILLVLPVAALLSPLAQADSISTVGSLPAGRDATSAVWDGQSFYVFGGRDGGDQVTTGIYRYNPVTNAASAMGSTLPRIYGTAAVWDGHNAYVIGGTDSTTHYDTIRRYDTSADSLVTMSAHLPRALEGPAAAWTGRYVYVFGGFTGSVLSSAIYRYDPATDSIATMGATLPSPLWTAGAVWDGHRVYVFGGHTDTSGGMSAAIYRYDPATDTVATMGATLPSAREDVSAIWDGAYAYVLGGAMGSTFSNQIVRYDPATDTATTMATTLPSARGIASAAWDCGAAYLFGGRTSSGVIADVVRYDTGTLVPTPGDIAAVGGPHVVNVTWSTSSPCPVTGYKLYRGTAAGGETLLATLGTTASYQDTGVADSTTYYYRVSALNGAQESALGAEVSAATFSPAGAPQGLVAAATAGRITLSWSAPASNGGAAVTGYKLYRGTSSGSETLLATLGNALSYVDASLAQGTTYYYKASAITAVGDGALSAEANAKAINLPSAPQGFTATPFPSYVGLSWSAPADDGASSIASYQLFRGTQAGGVKTKIADLPGWATSYHDAKPSQSDLYYELAAVNAAGVGPHSPEASAAVAGPTAFRVVAGTPGSNGWYVSPIDLDVQTAAALRYGAYPGVASFAAYRDDVSAAQGKYVDEMESATGWTPASVDAATTPQLSVGASDHTQGYASVQAVVQNDANVPIDTAPTMTRTYSPALSTLGFGALEMDVYYHTTSAIPNAAGSIDVQLLNGFSPVLTQSTIAVSPDAWTHVSLDLAQASGTTFDTVQVTLHEARKGVVGGASSETQTFRLDGIRMLATGGLHDAQDGRHAWGVVLVDGQGRREALASTTYGIDTHAPTTTASLSGTAGSNGWFRSAVTVSLTATDATSGVASTWYRVDGGPLEAYSAPFTVGGDGSHSVSYYSVDNASNQEGVRTQAVGIDTVAPVTSASFSRAGGVDGSGTRWYPSGTTLTLSGSDATSGVDRVCSSVNGGAETCASGASASVALTTAGAWSVSYHAVDRAGNVEATHTLTFSVDLAAPAVDSRSPSPGTVGVTTSSYISAHFHDPTPAASGISCPATTIKVEAIVAGVATDVTNQGTTSCQSTSIAWFPRVGLAPQTTYRVTGVVVDIAGNAAPLEGSGWSFTTGVS